MVLKEIETVILMKKDFRTHIPKPILRSIGAKEGDYIRIKLMKDNDE